MKVSFVQIVCIILKLLRNNQPLCKHKFSWEYKRMQCVSIVTEIQIFKFLQNMCIEQMALKNCFFFLLNFSEFEEIIDFKELLISCHKMNSQFQKWL